MLAIFLSLITVCPVSPICHVCPVNPVCQGLSNRMKIRGKKIYIPFWNYKWNDFIYCFDDLVPIVLFIVSILSVVSVWLPQVFLPLKFLVQSFFYLLGHSPRNRVLAVISNILDGNSSVDFLHLSPCILDSNVYKLQTALLRAVVHPLMLLVAAELLQE